MCPRTEDCPIALTYPNSTQPLKRLVLFMHFLSPRRPLGGAGCSDGLEEGHLLTAPLENGTLGGSPSCRHPSKITWDSSLGLGTG